MGIFDLFRGGRPEQAEEEKAHFIDLANLPKWLDEQFGSEKEAAEKQSRKMGSYAIESLANVKDRLRRLEKSSFGGRDKTFAAANMAKDSFVRRGLSIIEGLRFSGPGKETYSGLSEFNERLKDALKEMNKTSPKQLFLLSRYFKDDSRRYMDSLKELKERTNRLSEFLEKDGRIISMTETLELQTRQLDELVQRLSRLKAQQKEIEAGIAGLEQSKKESKSELEMFLGGREWKEMARLEEAIQEGMQEASRLEGNANEILGSAKRPLKKLRHLMESREAFPENPFRDIVIAGREAWLAGLLESAKEHAADGSISLKQREADRLDEVRAWLKNDLPKIKEQHNQLKEKTVELKRRAAKPNIKEKKADMEKQLREAGERLKKRWAELDSKIREAKAVESEAEELKQRTEQLVLESGNKKLFIRMPNKPDTIRNAVKLAKQEKSNAN